MEILFTLSVFCPKSAEYNNNYSFVILYLLTTYLQAIFPRYISHTTIRYSGRILCVSPNTYSFDLYSQKLQTTTVFFTRNAILLKSDWISTQCRLLYVALLQSNTITIINVLEVERSCSRIFENSTVISFMLLYNLYSSWAFVVLPLSYSYWCCWFN